MNKAIQRPEWLTEEPAEVYHKKSGKTYLSSHLLADFCKSPLLYHRKVYGQIKVSDITSFRVGRAAHSLILEGREAFDAEFITTTSAPKSPSTGKTYRSNAKEYIAWAKEHENKSIIKQEDYLNIECMAASTLEHEEAHKLLSGGFAEGVCRADYCGTPCQIRMDYWNPQFGLIDLKTTTDLDWFACDMQKYGYIYQLAFYRSILEIVSGKKADVYVVAVEKSEPYRCGVWKIADRALDYACNINEEAIQRLIECIQAEHWPTGYELTRMYEAV